MFHRNDYNPVMYLYTRGAVVYAGDHNGTLVHVYEHMGGPCIQLLSCLSIALKSFLGAIVQALTGLK